MDVIKNIIDYLNTNNDNIEPEYRSFVNSNITFYEQNGYVGKEQLTKIKAIYYQVFASDNIDKIAETIDVESKYYSFVTSCYEFYLNNSYLGKKQAIALYKIYKFTKYKINMI